MEGGSVRYSTDISIGRSLPHEYQMSSAASRPSITIRTPATPTATCPRARRIAACWAWDSAASRYACHKGLGALVAPAGMVRLICHACCGSTGPSCTSLIAPSDRMRGCPPSTATSCQAMPGGSSMRTDAVSTGTPRSGNTAVQFSRWPSSSVRMAPGARYWRRNVVDSPPTNGGKCHETLAVPASDSEIVTWRSSGLYRNHVSRTGPGCSTE